MLIKDYISQLSEADTIFICNIEDSEMKNPISIKVKDLIQYQSIGNSIKSVSYEKVDKCKNDYIFYTKENILNIIKNLGGEVDGTK